MSSFPHRDDKNLIPRRTLSVDEISAIRLPSIKIRSRLKDADREIKKNTDDTTPAVIDLLSATTEAATLLEQWRRDIVAHLVREGLSTRAIAQSAGISHETARRWAAEAPSTPTVSFTDDEATSHA